MIDSHLLLLCCLLGVGLAWNQPSTCHVRQSSCSSGAETEWSVQEALHGIQQTLDTSFKELQQTIATSLDRFFERLAGKLS